MLIRNATLFLASFLMIGASLGCGSDSRSYHVKGTVTFNGKLVPAGTIQFVPKEGQDGLPGHAKIVNGKFDTSTVGGKGTIGGKHTVIINGFDGNPIPDAELPLGKQLFPEYKVDFDVPMQSDPATQNFKVVINQV